MPTSVRILSIAIALVLMATGCSVNSGSRPTTTVTVTAPLSPPEAAYLNVRDFGAKGDWQTDDTEAIQRALDAVPASGGVVFFPAGGYAVPNGGLVCNRTVTLLGVKGLDGTGSRIHVSADNVVGVELNGQASVIDSLEITRPAPSSAPGLVGAILNSDFAEVRFSRIAGFNVNLRIAGTFYTVTNSSFRNFFAGGVEIDNRIAKGDAGDGTVTASTFERATTTTPGGAALLWRAGGGLRFVNNKINGETSLEDGILMAPVRDVVTGVLLVNSNSIENFNGAGVKVVDGEGEIRSSLIVSDNEIASYSTNRNLHRSIGVDIAESISGVSITGNSIYATGYGISVDLVQHATISGNSMADITHDGITVGERSADVLIAPQAIEVLRGREIVKK